MSLYSKEMPKSVSMMFSSRKKKFKRGKPCKACGKRLPPSKMSVDHIIPVEQYEGSPFDVRNWQVLCLPCHRIKTTNENIAAAQRRKEYEQRER